MAVSSRYDLVGSVGAGVVLTVTVGGEAVAISQSGQDYVGYLEAIFNSGASPTLDATIQTSADGTNWVAWGAFTQVVGATSRQRLVMTAQPFSLVRVLSTLGGTTPNYTVRVQLYEQRI